MAIKLYAEIYHRQFSFNVLPVAGKKPIIAWSKWQTEKQSNDDLEKMEWNNCSGVGISLGLDDLRLLDLDGVEDHNILDNLLHDLELPSKYPWAVQSGSGEGFHITFRVKETELLKSKIGDKAVYKLGMKEKGLCKHIELRWKNCQTVFPPSQHINGGVYKFYFDDPKEMPVYLDTEKLLAVLDKYCILESPKHDESRDLKEESKNDDELRYDQKRLESALNHLSEKLPPNTYEEWYRIGFGLVPLGTIGEEYFVKMSLSNPNYNDSETEIRAKFAELSKKYDGRVSFGTIYHLAERYGWKKPEIIFWSIDDRDKPAINRTRFKRFLESEGFCKYKLDRSYLFVRIENNIISEIETIDVKEFVMKYLNTLPMERFEGTSKTDVIDALIRSNNQLFTLPFLEFLITKNICFNTDAIEKGYFYYQNGYVEVIKSDVIFRNYSTLNEHIWEKQIIKRDYLENNNRSVFEKFMFNICDKDVKRFNALRSSIGYLLHRYKDPSASKAIIYIDEKMSDSAFGRSGKGLMIKSIAQVRNIVIQDGRNFSPSKNFAFQRVKADTDILALEDIRAKFPFENMFSVITEGITIERKNRDEVFLPFSESPKLVISTNFSIGGVDDSTLDRQFIVEFSDFYNKHHKPVDDFGKLFFDGWDKEEWNAFDCFMIECMQLYLSKGLLNYEHVNLDKKKLIDETSPEFAEFSEDFELGTEYDKKDLFTSFKRNYPDFEKLEQRTFTKWMKTYGRINELGMDEKKSGAKRTIEYTFASEKAE